MVVHAELPEVKTIGPCQDKPEEIRCGSCIMDTSIYFSGLSLETKRDLQRFMQLKRFNTKEFLYKEGEACEYVFIILSGEVKIFKSLLNGKQQIHKLAQIPGDLIPCEDLFLDKHGSSAEALSDVTVCCLERDDLLSSTSKCDEVSTYLMQTMSRSLNSYILHIANLGQKNALERIASYLVYLYETHHQPSLNHSALHESLSRVELADMLGVSQRTLIRSLKKLESEKIIAMNRNAFVILDIDSLHKVSQGV